MASYKTLLSEKDFLKVKLRARAVSKNGTNLYAIYYKDRTLYFKTQSVTDPRLIYTERIEMTDVTIENILNCKSFRELENLIKSGNIKIHCSCPAFLYWGYKYKAWKGGYGIEKEIRRPKIRNPYERGYVCKHLYYIMQVFPLLARPIASKYRFWLKKKQEWTGNVKQSKYFGTRTVTTDLSKNETISLPEVSDSTNIQMEGDTGPEVMDTINTNEPLITEQDIIQDAQSMSDISDHSGFFGSGSGNLTD